MTGIVRALVCAALVCAAAPVAAQVILPGQEEVLAGLLGRGVALPDGCTFTDGEIAPTVVRATYRCAAGDVVIELAHHAAPGRAAIRTERFALSVVAGSPSGEFLRALEMLVRARERDFDWSVQGVAASGAGFAAAVLRAPVWVFGILLAGLTIGSAISARRAWSAGGPVAWGVALESLVVAVVVVVWLQIRAQPPAHGDTAVDVALARDCIATRGAVCFGHAASALGLVQGQAFTYALAVWLALGLSMRALCFLAACVDGAAVGLLHHAMSRRFGAVAWIASALVARLGVDMTGYPTIWNPTWFLPALAAGFVATLTMASGSGIWSASLAGVALALATESHVLFATVAAVCVVIALVTGRRALTAATALLAAFVLSEVVVSPLSSSLNGVILARWLTTHRLATIGLAMSCIAGVPVLRWLRRRMIAATPDARERVAAAVWLSGGAAIGLVLPWAASRPAQIRYYGAAFPAIAYAAAWLLDVATMHTRSRIVHALAIVVFAAIFAEWIADADFAKASWFMDDGSRLADAAGLVDESALDIQMIVRSIPTGQLDQVTAAFGGTAGLPAFPPRIVRAVRVAAPVEAPAGWARLPGAYGDVFVGDIAGWTHPEEAEVCPEPATGEPCVTVGRGDFEAVARDADGAVHRVFGLRLPRIAAAIGSWAERGTRAVVWRIPVRAAGADDVHEVVFSEGPAEHVLGVDGTGWTPRGGTRAAIDRPPPAATASISVRTPVAGRWEAGLPPMPVELRADEAEALRSMLPP